LKLLLDEMWSGVIAEQLRNRGHDVVAVVERQDLVRQLDPVILLTALREERAIVTENGPDFRELVEQGFDRGQSHFGLICTNAKTLYSGDSRTIGRLVTALDALLTTNPDFTNREHWLS
jgi:predicted nuclease of predicted toxin-antitoxin system